MASKARLQDKYTWTDRVGQGSYGVVYFARRKDDGQSVAIKFLPEDTPEDCEASLREIDFLKQCTHENVIEMIEHFSGHKSKAKTWAALIMPVADQGLDAYLSRRRGHPCTDSFTRAVAGQLALGLEHLHAKNVIHRDLKPGNVLLFWMDVGQLRCVLADFGMARHVPAPRVRFRQKTECSVAGTSIDARAAMTARVATLWYRAPELLFSAVEAGDGEDDVDDGRQESYSTSIDVWSYGCVLYELLRGEPLAQADGPFKAVRCVWQVLGPCPSDLVLPRPIKSAVASWENDGTTRRIGSALGPISDVARTVLQWSPRLRPTMSQVRKNLLAGCPPEEVVPRRHVGGTSTIAQPSAVDAVPRLLQRLTIEAEIEVSDDACSCKGNCYTPGHKYHQGCSSKNLVKGSRYCVDCGCSVPGCFSPRCRSDMCQLHSRTFASLSQPLQLTRLTRSLLVDVIPIDIVDMVAATTRAVFRTSLAVRIIVALVKQTTATRIFLNNCEQQAALDGEGLARALARTVEEVSALVGPDAEKDRAEMHDMLRQGVGRFTGLASTATTLGVIQKYSKENSRASSQASSMNLGLGDLEYECTGDVSVMVAFVEVCNRRPPPPRITDAESLCAFSVWAGAAVAAAGEATPLRTAGPGYINRFIVRKLVIAELVTADARELDWGKVTLCMLMAISADAGEVLHHFPHNWAASDISKFLFDRDDWGLLASMFGCLWKEPCDKFGFAALAEVPLMRFQAVVTDFATRHLRPSPQSMAAVIMTGTDGAHPRRSHAPSPMARTPRSQPRSERSTSKAKTIAKAKESRPVKLTRAGRKTPTRSNSSGGRNKIARR